MLPGLSSALKSLVIDTSILFDFLIWRFSADTGVRIPDWLLKHLSSCPLKELGWYLGAARPIHTSSQVVAEIQGLAKSRAQLRDQRLESFWTLARQEFAQIQLVDHLVTMTEMDYQDFVRYGPTDASILRLAIRLEAAVLASDGPLRDRCVERETQVLNYDKVLELWKQGIT